MTYFQMLGYSQFHTLAHHVVIGNQVIVQGHRPRLVRSIIDCLKVSAFFMVTNSTYSIHRSKHSYLNMLAHTHEKYSNVEKGNLFLYQIC